MAKRSTALVTALGLAAASPAAASAVFYTDRASWAAAAGAPTFFEDFSGFAADTSFRSAAVALDGMSIVQLGSGSFRNVIDVGPDYDFTEHDDTSHASLFTNAAGGPTSAVDVRILFDAPNLAFGFEHWVAADQEGARLEIYDGAALVGSADLSNAFGGFLGYVLDGGDLASALLLRSIANLSGPGDPGEGFGIDRLEGVAVPEPDTLLLCALGLVGLCARRSRRAGERSESRRVGR